MIDEYQVVPFETDLVGVANFPLGAEDVQLIVASTPDMSRRAEVLGDDSVLVRYLNPNLLAVVSVSVGDFDTSTSEKNSDSILEDMTSMAFLTLVDGVSGRIVYRTKIEDASTPVHCTVIENSVITTYWNTKAKRTELSSIALYEGMVDKYGLGPFAKAQPLSTASTFSSFNSQSPIGMNSSYEYIYCM